MSEITPIGKTDWRNTNQRFGIKDQDRFAHLYCIGKSGVGKSTLLLNMAISDIVRSNGMCVLDPHADLAEAILDYIPQERIADVIYFNATDTEYCIGFNPLYNVQQTQHSLVTSNLISTFKKVWIDSWGPRLEYILRFSLLSLLYYPKATLLDIPQLLTDGYFRNHVLMHVPDAGILNFWRNEFDKYPPQLKAEAIAPILNKMGTLIASEPIRNTLGQVESSFTMQEVMDQKKILICNLAKGTIGEDASSLLGALILGSIQNTALARSSQAQKDRVPFYVYVDELHSFVTVEVCNALAESRKYNVSFFLTHQYLDQLREELQSAILGNVGTIISFRVGAGDAAQLAEEFYPVFTQEDLVHLPKHCMYIKLMIDGATSKPFSAKSLPITSQAQGAKRDIVRHSRTRHCKAIKEVGKEIMKRLNKQGIAQPRGLFD